MGNSQTKASNKYHAEKYDRLYPFVPKGEKEKIQAVAESIGESLNEFIVNAIYERMEYSKNYGKPQYKTDEAKEAIKNLRKENAKE